MNTVRKTAIKSYNKHYHNLVSNHPNILVILVIQFPVIPSKIKKKK